MKSEYIWLALAILLVIGIKMIPLFTNEYCLWWDCPYYLKNVASGNIMQEADPLYFAIAAPLNMLIGNEILTVKFLMVAMAIVFSIGTYMLCRKFMPVSYSIGAMVLANAMFGLNRMWFDQYRNYLLIALLPLFLYFYFSDSKNSTKLAIVLLALMSLSHPSFAIVYPAMLIYTLLNKDDISIGAKTTRIIIWSLSIYTFFCAFAFTDMFGVFGWGNLAITSLATDSSIDLARTHINFGIMQLHTYWLFIIAAVYSLFRYKEKYIGVFAVMLITMIIGCLMPFNSLFTIAERVIEIMAFPTAIIIAYMFYKELENMKELKNAVFTILLIALTIVSFTHITSIPDGVFPGEDRAYQILKSDEHAYIITTAREKYWMDYFNLTNYHYVKWEVLIGQEPPEEYLYNPDFVFIADSGLAKTVLDELSKNSTVYVYYTEGIDPVSREMFAGKDYLKIIHQDQGTYLMRFEDGI